VVVATVDRRGDALGYEVPYPLIPRDPTREDSGSSCSGVIIFMSPRLTRIDATIGRASGRASRAILEGGEPPPRADAGHARLDEISCYRRAIEKSVGHWGRRQCADGCRQNGRAVAQTSQASLPDPDWTPSGICSRVTGRVSRTSARAPSAV